MRRLALCLVLAPLLAACSDDKIGGVQGEVSADPASISFGKLFVGSSAFEVVKLSNAGRSPAQVSVTQVPEGFEVKPTEIVVPAVGEVEVKVYFAPSVIGAVTGNVVLGVVGADNDSVSIAVEGEGVERVLGYEEPVDFGLVEVGTTVSKPLKLTSLVDFHVSAPLTVVGGSGADVYSADLGVLELEAGASTDVVITFKPSRRGALNSFLEIQYCKDCAVSRIPLQGTGGIDALDAPPVDFRIRSPGSESSLPLSLHNTGDFPISIASLDLGESHPEFSIVDPRAVDLEPGEVVNFTVLLQAGEVHGARVGTVRFVKPGGEVRSEVVPLRATIGGIQIVATPEGQDFARQPVGIEARKTIILENIGEKKEVYLVNPVFEGAAGFKLEPVVPELAPAEGVPGGWKVDTAGTPVPFEVSFKSTEAGTFPGAVTFQIANPDGSLSVEQPSITVPVIAQAIEPLPCTLDVAPTAVRFGAVRAGRIYKKDIVVTNVGTDECFIWNVGLEEFTPRSYFALETDFSETTYVVAPGETLTARVMYAPKQRQSLIDESNLVFQQPAGEQRVRITGQAVGFNLLVDPNPIVQGTARLGERIFKDFSISNMGSAEVVLNRIQFAAGSHAAMFGLEIVGELPKIEGNGITPEGALSTWFKPSDPGTKVAQLEIFVDDVIEPIIVEVRGTGSTEECDLQCAAPEATCPMPVTASVNTRVTIEGRGFSPGGHDITCQWTVVQAPRGSRAQPGPGCRPDFTPDIVGDYVLELRVTDRPEGNWDTCQARLTATATGGLWVETFWDKAGDIDLHLLNAEIADPWQQSSWWSQADCHYGNKNPVWDAAYPGASPGLDRDDIPGTGPENIRITTPAPHAYAVGLHNFSNSRVPVEVTTNIYCGGTLLVPITTIFNATKDFCILGLVDDACNWTPDNTCWTGFH